MAPGDMQEDRQRGPDAGSAPVPDPTVLTTEALQREIGALRQLVELRVLSLRELVSERIDGIVEVREEEFRGVFARLEQVEQQRVEQKADTKAAVDAALTAQKEAVAEQTTASERSIAKSEAATTKSIEQLGSTFATDIGSVRREVGDLKERMTTVEQQKVGRQESEVNNRQHKESSNANLGLAIAGSAIFVALVSVLANIITSQ